MKFYRYYNQGIDVVLEKFKLLKETPAGYWIIPEYQDPVEPLVMFKDTWYRKWISKTSRKRFAYPTKEEALDSFKMRKKRQIPILEGQLDCVKEALKVAENIDTTLEERVWTVKKPSLDFSLD